MVLTSATEAPADSVTRPARRISSLWPREHGSWALALEPLALAMIVAPSGRGAALSLAAMGLFLMRRPWQVWQARCAPGGEPLAAIALLVLATCAALAGTLACAGVFERVAVPLAATALMGMTFAWFDARGEGRALAAELSGLLVFVGLATAAASLGGGEVSRTTIAAVGGFALVRGLTSVLPLRTYLRRRKGRVVSGAPALLAAFAAVIACALTAHEVRTWVPLAWALVFALRAVWLASPWVPHWTARRFGILEMVLGLASILTTGIALS